MDTLEHSGVKGMRWGVRHDEPHSSGGGSKSREPSKLQKHLSSMKRERDWHKVLGDIHSMNAKDMKVITARIERENKLKALSKHKIATKKDKHDYLRRHEMSDQELTRKITLLQTKANLHKAVKEASKQQREAGVKAAQIGGSIGLKYAIAGKRPTHKDIPDILNLINNPTIKTKQNAWDSSVDLLDSKTRNHKTKAILKMAREVKFKTKEKK